MRHKALLICMRLLAEVALRAEGGGREVVGAVRCATLNTPSGIPRTLPVEYSEHGFSFRHAKLESAGVLENTLILFTGVRCLFSSDRTCRRQPSCVSTGVCAALRLICGLLRCRTTDRG